MERSPVTDQPRLEPVDALTIMTLIDNSIDVFMPDQDPAHRFRDGTAHGQREARTLERGVVDEHPRAEHGFSALLTITRSGRRRSVLFDAGRTPEGLSHNLRCFAIDARDIEAIVLSHGHFDHTTGLDGLARQIGRRNLPVVIHPDFWSRRRLLLPGRDPWQLPSTSRAALEGVGFSILEGRQPSFLLDGSLLVTGEVDRTNGFEPGFPYQEAWRDGRWQPDPLVLDDQAIVVNLRGRGLVVLSGCGHAGMINILRHARQLTGVERVHLVMGGFHLNGPLYEPLIPRVCDELAVIDPAFIVPTHCTGWRATHAFGTRYPEKFLPNAVGTRFELVAQDDEVAVQPAAAAAGEH